MVADDPRDLRSAALRPTGGRGVHEDSSGFPHFSRASGYRFPDCRRPGIRDQGLVLSDVCVDSVSKTVLAVGTRQAKAHDSRRVEPVQIGYVLGMAYDGQVKWTNYDWSTQRDSAIRR
jgi:hypothetical protein